ncbi:hypothetical protein WMW78_29480, partial [Burkholderia pseudomallei]
HEHDISNAPLATPVYTVSNFNSLLGAGYRPLAPIFAGASLDGLAWWRPPIRAVPTRRGEQDRLPARTVAVQADRGYGHDQDREPLHATGAAMQAVCRGKPRDSGLRNTRWVVERLFAWDGTASGFRASVSK